MVPEPAAGHLDRKTCPARAPLYEAFFDECRRFLHDPSSREGYGKKAWACLAREGLTKELVARTPIGLLGDCSQMRARLVERGFSPQEVRESELAADPRLPGRLVGPIRDAQGEIVAFWARDPEGQSPRFLFKGDWKRQTPAIGLEVALPVVADGSLGLLLVEEIFDALWLQAQGFLGVAAVGGSLADLTSARWEAMASLGVGCVTLAPRGGRSADRLLENALDSAYAARRAPAVLVLPPDAWGEFRSINDLVRRGGIEGLCSALDRGVVHGYDRKARLLLARHRNGSVWTESSKLAAWNEAVRFYRQRTRAGVEDLDEFFVPPIAVELGIRWDLARFCPADPTPRSGVEAETPGIPSPPDRTHSQLPRGYCPIHRCHPLECFCFD
ncbi:MAG: hypothetical protein NUV77_00600 [Thermoguttaceae bacterium]|jgi:hypothetical protein|nr:hypothetical protein [Thermoguttaceae bacterium]